MKKILFSLTAAASLAASANSLADSLPTDNLENSFKQCAAQYIQKTAPGSLFKVLDSKDGFIAVTTSSDRTAPYIYITEKRADPYNMRISQKINGTSVNTDYNVLQPQLDEVDPKTMKYYDNTRFNPVEVKPEDLTKEQRDAYVAGVKNAREARKHIDECMKPLISTQLMKIRRENYTPK